MKISSESIAILRDKLPCGSAKMIKTRLSKKGINYSQQYIYRCLNPANQDYNPIIIDEAILLGEAITKGIEKKEERVANLRKAS